MANSKILDLKGERYGALVVIERTEDKVLKNGEKKICWICKCDCGNYKKVITRDLRRGSVTSCGCGINQANKRRKNDLTGKRFGKLIVIKNVSSLESGSKDKTLLCRCDCGSITYVNRDKLIANKIKSCGCLKKENIKNGLHTKYRFKNERLYNIWYAMSSRCLNNKNTNYYLYGGRGIKICDEWLKENGGFDNFYLWAMANGYSDNLTIDRIDPNGNYEPLNCRWITNNAQQNNKRNTIFLEYKGEIKSLKSWSNELGLSYSAMRWRYNRYNMGISEMIEDLKMK